MKLTRSDRAAKVAICIPCRDTLHSLFAYNLIQLVQYCNTVGIKTTVLMESGSLISRQRQRLAQRALEDSATHIMWLDSDMLFPSNVIESLMSHGKDIVACNYSTRSTPFKGVAYRKIGDWDSWLGYNFFGERLQVVEGVGMGCMLVSAKVFASLDLPWFEIAYSSELDDHIGEDFYFCQKAAAAGYPVHVDTIVSRDIKHLGTASFDLTKTIT